MSIPMYPQFRYADKLDVFLMVVGLTMAAASGILVMSRIAIIGGMSDMFITDARFTSWLDEHWDNITWLYTNITKDGILDDPDGFR